eukprot:7588753-Pyramimonas_sp.AAC.1
MSNNMHASASIMQDPWAPLLSPSRSPSRVPTQRGNGGATRARAQREDENIPSVAPLHCFGLALSG